MSHVEDEERLNRLATAHHEAAHAVAHKLAGGRVHEVRFFSATAGGTKVAEDGPGGPVSNLGWLVMLLAGGEAELRFLDRDPRVGRRQARAAVAAGCRGDLTAFRAAARGTGISERRARAAARSLVSAHWGRIARVAAKLDQRHRLHHGDI